MDFEAEADKLTNELSPRFEDAWGPFIIDALRRAYATGAADALVKKLDAIVGDDWAPVAQEGE